MNDTCYENIVLCKEGSMPFDTNKSSDSVSSNEHDI